MVDGSVAKINKLAYDRRKTVGAACGGPTPSFLVLNMDNVNARLHKAQGLLTLWDFLEHKGRIGKTNIVLQNKENRKTLKVMPVTCRSRYFSDGRLNISHKIMKRLGNFNRVPGLMVTLTYNPKAIQKRIAWSSFGHDVRVFLNAVNQYRKRRGWQRLHYFWVVEVQKQTGYPHLHIFFPNLRWIAPVEVLKGNWSHGRSNIGSPKRITVNCAGYISKYLRKMTGWLDLHLALLWSGKCRMYGFSRGFSIKADKKEPEWERFGIINTDDVIGLKKSLTDVGYKIDEGTKKVGQKTVAVEVKDEIERK